MTQVPNSTPASQDGALLQQARQALVFVEDGLEPNSMAEKMVEAAIVKLNAAIAQPAQPALVPVYLVATGEVYEHLETYTRHDVCPPGCDAEKLYTAPQSAQPVQPAAVQPMYLFEYAKCAENLRRLQKPYPRTCELCGLGPCKAAIQASAVPDGMCLVPIEATEEMVDAGGHSNSEWLNAHAPIGEARYAIPMKSVWRAMIAAHIKAEKD